MKKQLIVRNDQVVQVWQIGYKINGFDYALFVEGTENEVRDYMDSEMGFMGRYSACTDDEIAAAKKLRFPIYIAPQDSMYMNQR